jgi:recombination protein RecA
MPASSALRIQIERAFEYRFPAALTPAPRTIREVASTGVGAVDVLLGGGLPIGAISELTGPESSGRTSLALSFVAERTEAEQVCAWIDADDALDPESASACGIELERLLWVRCRNAKQETKTRPWIKLDQALRATDLLLQVGGFAAIILDLGDVAPQHGNRIPLATWFRFRHAADRTRCSLVVISKASYAQSSAAVVLECMPKSEENAGQTVLRGFTYETRRRRERFSPFSAGSRKPPASTWTANASWESRRQA